MYKCVECGHLFDLGEEAIWTEPHGEKMTGCPICKCAFEYTDPCKICGGAFLEDELYQGICKRCLLATITPEITAKYAKDIDKEPDFYIGYFYNSDFRVVSRELLTIAKCGFDQASSVCGEATLRRCIAFIDDDEAGLYDYAMWIAKTDMNVT